MEKDRILLVVASVLCAVLAIGLVGSVVSYSTMIEGKDTQISVLEEKDNQNMNTISFLNEEVAALRTNISDRERQISEMKTQADTLDSRNTGLQSKVNNLTGIINGGKPSELTTLIWHVSEKGEGYTWGRTPDVQYTYRKILNLSLPYEVLLLPEYEGNLNWDETYNWVSTNFTGIPICLSVFEGGSEKLPNPNLKLTVSEIQQAMFACNVKAVRLAEIISWYMDNNQTFPTDYVKGILSFCRSNNLRVIWSEWKIGDNVIQPLQAYIEGYEDIVTVLYQTNNECNEPLEGFTAVSQFQHWGGSIQSWYAVENLGDSSDMDMPCSMLIRHAQTAISMGAEVLQFESCRYFFDNGEPRDVTAAVCLAIK